MSTEGDYVTIAQVREEAGFVGNHNITNNMISDYILTSESEIKGVIAKKYTLPLSEVPGVVKEMARQLAAGLLLLKEYGPDAEGTTKDGLLKVKWARNRLKEIKENKFILLDSNNDELATSDRIAAEGWPLDSTGTDKTDDANKDDPPIFEIGEQF